jgi:predicted transcriptional regulator
MVVDTGLEVRQQQYVKLLFKFRFVSASSLSLVLGVRREAAYKALEFLVSLGLVVKVYESSWRTMNRPAYYYLSHEGVSIVRKILGVKEPVVHALYKNADVSDEFVSHCMDVLATFPIIRQQLPVDAELLTKTELRRFDSHVFPKTRPDIYIRQTDGKEAFVIFLHDYAPYVVRKRINELLDHFNTECWDDGDYPRIALVCKDEGSKRRLLGWTARKLDNIGVDEEELQLVATTMDELKISQETIWASVYTTRIKTTLFI